MKQLRDDNNGLSLIEVMVAIIILAIVVTPFLHSFVTTANANAKAKSMHRATTVAQSVVESLKGDSLIDISKEFNVNWTLTNLSDNPTGVAATTYYECDENGNQITDEGAKSCYTEDGGSTYKLRKNADGSYAKDQYFFMIDDLKEEHGTYDVMLKLTGKSATSGSVLEFNNTELTQLPIINEDVDAICLEQSSYLDDAIRECGIDSRNSVPKTLERQIEIEVKKTPKAGGDARVTVMVTFKYENVFTSKKKEIKVTCYDSDQTGEDLRNIYLYYRPLYSNSARYDQVIYKNESDVPLNLYLFKQEVIDPSDVAPGSDIVTMTTTQVNAGMKKTTINDENNYQMRLRLYGGASTSWEDFKKNTTIYTNLFTNIKTGDPIAANKIDIYYRDKTRYSGSSLNLENKITGSKIEQRVYEMEISVFPSDTTSYARENALVTLDSEVME